jgi:hypothetical protein
MPVFSQPLLVSTGVATLSTLSAMLLYLLLRARAEKNFFTPLGHIVQISILIFPTTLFFSFLLLNSLIVHLISIFVVIFLLGVSIEAQLRKIVKSVGRTTQSFRLNEHKWGLLLPFEEAKFATGGYPREYLTKKFYDSVRHHHWKEWSIKDFESNNPSVHFDENPTINVDDFSIINGLRTTSHQPEEYDFNILLFGGSTTLMEEVPDDLTYASFLQRCLNLDKNVRVINHGRGGASVLNRVSFLVKNRVIVKGDVVILYFGVNDCGRMVRGRWSSSLRSPLLILFGRVGLQKSEIGKWVRGELLFRHNSRCSISAFNSTVSAINELKEFVESRGAKLLIVLQPNLFVSKIKSDYEKSLRSRWSSFTIGQVNLCYPKYEDFVNKCSFGISLTTIFDNLETIVYLDWCHVNARGAEIIADRLHRELVKLSYV